MSDSCCTRFLSSPMSSVKILLPSVAIQALLHNKLWPTQSLRQITLYLALLNTYWFATTFNFSFLETPFLVCLPTVNKKQRTDCGRHRFNWLNKMEIFVSVLGLDLFCEWRKRILDHNGFVDVFLSSAVLLPVLATAVQGAYLLPKINERARLIEAVPTTDDLYEKDRIFPNAHRAYIGFEGLKVIGLAVAGIRFGKMLTI
ncbi:hypothetical protein J3Q64DRAFT_1673935 [Phycomyces blakesleeanus]|uniref:DUF4149 domain-containing protein n=2 Tax=Phycomyces blakesleeanus TaxID=4837 RepID=A0A167R2V1_PHYB8|nr:hypothetical protein PHYBLDRAFT_138259 [Phycomyces blakesleeanus NRRL 1555(-)]OAD80714.1 hypothetical protein PHYBLDRAFT_138259 [Phycomyces blakesleeanus NRRL 1555(-)]|eukprot:XP_018298754.1 hypothetical protein PHYBLDRAFT_138259 [Phycomyces blakesleeanus NRRL 1555(-)]